MIALKHVEEVLGPTPAHKRFPLNMEVTNVMDLLLLMKAVMFKNVQVMNVHVDLSSSFFQSSIPLNTISNINLKYHSVDCQWAEWQIGDCSETCGDGVRENHGIKLTEALFGGASCEGKAKATESCNNGICPGTQIFQKCNGRF